VWPRIPKVRLEGTVGVGGIDSASVDAVEAAFKSKPAAVILEVSGGFEDGCYDGRDCICIHGDKHIHTRIHAFYFSPRVTYVLGLIFEVLRACASMLVFH